MSARSSFLDLLISGIMMALMYFRLPLYSKGSMMERFERSLVPSAVHTVVCFLCESMAHFWINFSQPHPRTVTLAPLSNSPFYSSPNMRTVQWGRLSFDMRCIGELMTAMDCALFWLLLRLTRCVNDRFVRIVGLFGLLPLCWGDHWHVFLTACNCCMLVSIRGHCHSDSRRFP